MPPTTYFPYVQLKTVLRHLEVLVEHQQRQGQEITASSPFKPEIVGAYTLAVPSSSFHQNSARPPSAYAQLICVCQPVLPPPTISKTTRTQTIVESDRESTPRSLESAAQSPARGRRVPKTPDCGRARPLHSSGTVADGHTVGMPVTTPPPSIRKSPAEEGRSISVPATRMTAAASSGKLATFGRRQSDSTFECTVQASAFQRLRSRSLIEDKPRVQEEEEVPVSTADRFQQQPSGTALTPVRAASASASASASSSAQASPLKAPPALSPAQATTPAKGSPLRKAVDAHLAPLAESERTSGLRGESLRSTADFNTPDYVAPAAARHNTPHPVNPGWSAPQSAGTLRLPTLPATWMALSSAALQRTLGQPGVGAHRGVEQFSTPMAAWLPNRSASSSYPPQSVSTSMTPFSPGSDFQQVRGDRDEDRDTH